MPIPILTYHQIDNRPPANTPHNGLIVSPNSFARQMRWLHRLGYTGLSMRDLMPFLQGTRRGKVFGLTFDDGYCNVLNNAVPVLASLGFTATNYFVTRQFGGSNLWDSAKGVPTAKLMSAHEIRAWVDAGHEAGSHTLDHACLPELGADDAYTQIYESKLELEQLLGCPVTAFCYPYGRHTQAHREMARVAGYDNATTTIRGRATYGDDLFGLPRIYVSGTVSTTGFLRKCLTRYTDRKRKEQ